MRLRILLLIGLMTILEQNTVFGQAETDTLGLTGTMADTVVARRLYYAVYQANQSRKLDEAIEKIDSVLLIYNNVLGTNTTQYANALNLKGSVFLNTGLIDSAISNFYQTIKIRESVLGAKHLDVAGTYHNLAIAYSRQQKFENAIPYFLHSQSIRLEQLPKNDPEMIWSYHDLGITYLQMGKYREAEFNLAC